MSEVSIKDIAYEQGNRYTIPRTYGVYKILITSAGLSSRVFRFGNHPVRWRELLAEFGDVELVSLYNNRNSAIARARSEESKLR